MKKILTILAATLVACTSLSAQNWEPKGENINVSALLKFSTDSQPGFRRLPVSEAILLTCCTTLGIRDYLLEKEVDSRIKWPNDIWVGEKKICGILVENSIRAGRIDFSIVGVGLDVNQTDWPADLPNPVSLKELTGRQYDTREELLQLHDALARRSAQTSTPEGTAGIIGEFNRIVIRLDRTVPDKNR